MILNIEIKIIKNSTKINFLNIKNIEITIIKNSTTINFLEHKEHRKYNHKEQYNNKLPGT
jgi:hypothetical protein